MATTEQNDAFHAGNRRRLRFEIEDADNAPDALDLTGLTAKWACAPLRFDRTFMEPASISKETGAGITVIGSAVDGVLEVELLGADSASLEGEFYHELELFDGDGNGLVVATGTLTIYRNLINPAP